MKIPFPIFLECYILLLLYSDLTFGVPTFPQISTFHFHISHNIFIPFISIDIYIMYALAVNYVYGYLYSLIFVVLFCIIDASCDKINVISIHKVKIFYFAKSDISLQARKGLYRNTDWFDNLCGIPVSVLTSCLDSILLTLITI